MPLKKVLIIGCNGFLGSSLSLDLLNKGCTVIGFYNSSKPSFDHSNFYPLKGLLARNDFNAFLSQNGDLDAIFFLAGSGSVGSAFNNPYYDFYNSAVLLSVVLDALKVLSLQRIRLIFSSSAAVYGNQYSDAISEYSQLFPISPYGTHKKICEELIGSYVKYYGINASILRFFSIYGPRNKKQLIWDACLKFKAGSHPLFFGSGSELRDWLYIDDAVAQLIYAANIIDNRLVVVNGSLGFHYSVSSIVDLISKYFPGSSYRFTGTKRVGDPLSLIGNSSEAKRIFPISQPHDISQGISSTIRWFDQCQER